MSGVSFLDLPPEVRNQIYEHLFEGAIIEDHGYSPTPIQTRNYHLPITVTNRQIRIESLTVLQSTTTLHFRIGQAGTPPVPPKVLQEITRVRIPAHRLPSLDLASFRRLKTLILDVLIDPAIWQLLLSARAKSSLPSTDISDMIHISMTLGVFEHSWDVEKMWKDEARNFRILCWISSWVRDVLTAEPVLVDLDAGVILRN